MKTTKVCLMVSGLKGLMVLKTMIENKKNDIGLVISFEETNMRKKYYNQIKNLCERNDIPFFTWSEVQYSIIGLIKEYRITETIAISWKYKIELSANEYLRHGIIVFHDSLLPKYRGFTPTPTAIINGEKIIGVSVILASNDIDSGEIILQEKIHIDEKIYIGRIMYSQGLIYCKLILKLLDLLEKNSIVTYPQDESLATYSVWRNPEDCRIDWNMSSKQICNLVRAVSFPYTGAFTYMEGEKIYIWKSKIVEDKKFVIRYPGKVWEIDPHDNPTIICGEGMIKLIDVTDEDMKKINFNKIRVRLN